MYAIKIVSDSTVFHLAEEISYRHCKYASTADYWAQVEIEQPTHQIGDSPKSDGKDEGWYVDLNLYKDNVVFKELFVMPMAWIYIMQDGKTIEVVNVK